MSRQQIIAEINRAKRLRHANVLRRLARLLSIIDTKPYKESP
jgi:hypothetical protein